jgi:beta-galactosidase
MHAQIPPPIAPRARAPLPLRLSLPGLNGTVLALFLCTVAAAPKLAAEARTPPQASADTPNADAANLINFDLGWRFNRGDIPGAERPDFDDHAWREVDLPHDWSIEDPAGPGSDPHDRTMPEGDNVGYFRGGTGWYRNAFVVAPADAGKSVEILFDGVQQESDVWINGRHLGFQPHGYVPFHYDLTPYLKRSGQPNLIAVRAINPERNSRWYPGSGLYRPVALRFHDPVHIPVDGVSLDTLWLGPQQADLQVRVRVENERPEPADLNLTLQMIDPAGGNQKFDLGRLTLAGKSREQVSQKIAVRSPQSWSTENPNLYRAIVTLSARGASLDRHEQSFGVRTIAVSAEKGFLLNGQPVKLKGCCVHHDNGLLGAAAFASAEERRVALLKRTGFNAIRTSHNPPSRAFLEACDRLGLLVIDEFVDMWELPKPLNGYNRYFARHWEQDLRAMLARDYNHPSVVIWSIGNEIPERAKPPGLEIGRKLVDCIRSVDRLRPVTNAISGFWDNPDWEGQWDPSAPAFALLDVGGYNYYGSEYENDHAKFPARVMVGTESFPLDAYNYWRLVEQHPYVIGDFVWTGIDYLGEAGLAHNVYVDDASAASAPKAWDHMPWPTSVSWCGDLDLTGNKKPQSYFRDVVWDRSPIELAVHAPVPPGKRELVSQWGWPDEQPSWNWAGAQGQPLQVHVYSKAPRVRLELNARVVGEQVIDREKGITATFQVPYEPGVLRACALEDGQVVASCVLRTSGAAASIALLPEGTVTAPERGRVIFVPIELRDAAGQLVPDASRELLLELSGPAELQGFGSANPAALGSLTDAKTETFHGRALAILRPTGQPGVVRIAAKSPGLASAQVEIPLKAPTSAIK